MIFNERSFLVPTVTFNDKDKDEDEDEDSDLAALKCMLLGYEIEVTDKQLESALSEAKKEADAITAIMQIVSDFAWFEVAYERHPADHLLMSQNWPAIVEIRPADDQPPHFVVIWNRIGPFIQVMDPKFGRRWLREEDLLELLQNKEQSLAIDDGGVTITGSEWLEIAPSWRASLHARLSTLYIEPEQAEVMINTALAEPNMRLATLDAAIRMVATMVRKGRVQTGAEAKEILEVLYEEALKEMPASQLAPSAATIHPVYWSVQPLPDGLASSESAKEGATLPPLRFRGIAVIRVIKKKEVQAATDSTARDQESEETPEDEQASHSPDQPTLQSFLMIEGRFTPSVIGLAMVLAAGGVFFQAILFRGFMELGLNLQSETRSVAIGLLLVFAITLFFIRWPMERIMSTMGRKLDTRLRLAIFSIIPFLSPRYFQNESLADIIERIHQIRTVDFMINIAGRRLWLASQLLFTIVGIGFIDLLSAPLAILRTAGVLMISFNLKSLLSEYNLNIYKVSSKLSRSYLDAMRGLVALRTHGAEQAVRHEYDNLLAKWGRKKLALYKAELWVSALDQIISWFLMAGILLFYAARDGEPKNFLLLFFWAFNLDHLAFQSMMMFFLYLRDKGKATRYLQLLDAPQERDILPSRSENPKRKPKGKAVQIIVKGVNVEIAGRPVLSDINLTIEAGTQIAIVGPSGAGKSTLIGLLMGSQEYASGQILIDGEELSYESLQTLRQESAWVDPKVQLWNRSFLYNLRYGGSSADEPNSETPAMNSVIKKADLSQVLKRLPKGLSTELGQEGRLLSGGEGQRVRFGRSMQRADARLVILDEAFRGLDRAKRGRLLAEARSFWREATLICVTHDIGMTQDFERVLVIENGQIIEDGVPKRLAEQADSRYHALLKAEKTVRETLWKEEVWRHLWLEEGQLSERF